MGLLKRLASAFSPQTTEQKPPAKGAGLVEIKPAKQQLLYRADLTGWTPDRVMSAINSAESGNLMAAADLCEAILTDSRVGGVLDTRTQGLLGLPLSFVGGSDEAKAALEGDQGEFWKMTPESELVKLLQWGLMLGVGLAQLVPLPRVIGTPQQYRLETWSPRWLRYQQARASRASEWTVQTDEGVEPLRAGDGTWILFTPYGTNRPWSSGLYLRVGIPWLLKRFSVEDRANQSETLGSPMWVGIASSGSTEKQRNKFLQQLKSLGKSGKMVLPHGWDFRLSESTSKSWEIYTEQVKWSNEEIAISIAGQIVTTEGTSGFSSGNIFDAIKGDYIRFDGQRLTSCIREQVIEPWALSNYGSRAAAPWPEWNTTRPTDMDVRAESLSKLGGAIAQLDAALLPHKLRCDARSLCEKFAIDVVPVPDTPAAVGNVQDTAMNGAQVASMVQVVTTVAAGQLPRTAGIGMLGVGFRLTEAEANRVMGDVGAGFVPSAQVVPAPNGGPTNAGA